MTTSRPRAGADRGGDKERAARAAIGMRTGHPRLVTRKPGRAEWEHSGAWRAELWPHDEYTEIVSEAWRQDRP